MKSDPIELRVCLANLERMIKRAHLLSIEYEEASDGGTRPVVGGAKSLQNAISFSELRSLDLLCKDAIERSMPDQQELLKKWHVYGETGGHVPEEVHLDLVAKRQILLHAINLMTTRAGAESHFTLVPYGYEKLADPVQFFFEDSIHKCEDYDRNVFIMTRFQKGNPTLEKLDSNIRKTLDASGFIGHRADDRCYPQDRNLWDNVCTYMIGCKYGIAVLENILAEEFNPNVAMEYGFMRALGKPTLLLKERRFTPRADILGTLWSEFDILDIGNTIPSAINKWLDDMVVR